MDNYVKTVFYLVLCQKISWDSFRKTDQSFNSFSETAQKLKLQNADYKGYFQIKKKHVPVGDTPRHLELKKMVLPIRILKRVRNLYLAVSKHKNLWQFQKIGSDFWLKKKKFFDTPHFFLLKIKKKSFFWYSFFVKKMRFASGNLILNFLVETISSFRPV